MIAFRRSTVLADVKSLRAHARTCEPCRSSTVSLVRTGAGATGTDAENDLADASTTADVDRVARRYLKNGDVPSYIATSFWSYLKIEGNGHVLELRVAPDYFALGTNDDPLRLGKTTEAFAQEVADTYNAILPSQKLLRDIEAAASPKIPYIAVQKGGGADDSVAGMITASKKAAAAFDKYGTSPTDGKIKIGYKKSYVTRPNLDGKYLAIYGGRWGEGGGLVQPTSGHAHTEGYADYSHGLTLVSRKAVLDGAEVDLRDDVFGSKDPAIYSLVSDEGRFDPVFPNAGSGSAAKFSYGGSGEESGEGAGSGGGSAFIPTYSASDSSIASIQRALQSLGYSVGSSGADGKLGPDTNAAIIAFKSDHSLPANATMDADFRSALSQATISRASASAGGLGKKPLLILGALALVGLLVWVIA